VIRSLQEYVRMIYVEQTFKKRGYMSVEELLEPSSLFHADFLPIYEHLMRFPVGTR
jgi:hypothetical protein